MAGWLDGGGMGSGERSLVKGVWSVRSAGECTMPPMRQKR